ncbi:DUF3718 domain-containing protein [Aestuariibacter salexigens]|uniref:DUF3718 domain-containing protein n=1 Tax=Aestuariibacter salexigens TaxID=226010 RepID=UPI00047BA099|nr:DUF3718 domain-containing protein [Aestuariibacter salexigens]
MLKIAQATLLTVAASASFVGTAQADVNDALQNICTIVQANDKGELRKKMRTVENDFKLKLQDYYNGITCSGESLIRTAFKANALETGELLVKKMPKSQLNSPEADGLTIRAWVSENGFMDTPLANILNERI